MMATVGTHAINASLYKDLAYDPVKDFTPIALVAAAPVAPVAIHRCRRTRLRTDRASQAQPGTMSFGTAGNGTPGHLTGEMFRTFTGADLKHVPYKGSAPAITDLIGGQIQLMFDPLQSVLPHVQAGKLRLLAVSSATRSAAAPDAPTFSEAGLKDFEATAWWGVFAPANLPSAIAAQLNAEIDRIVHSEAFRERLVPRGVQVIGGSREEFAQFQQRELLNGARRCAIPAPQWTDVRLSDLEQAMLAGEMGPVRQLALRHQIKVGDFFGAEDFVGVTQAHVMADTESLGESGVAGLKCSRAMHPNTVRYASPRSPTRAAPTSARSRCSNMRRGC